MPRPNILFIFTDDQRYDAVRALGTRDLHTPNMDALVRSGVTFTHASIMGSTMPAVCCPSRAMLMSGRSLFHAPTDLAGVPTFPEVLRDAGYATFGTGKWHNERESFARSFTDGGSIFFGGMSNHLEVPVYDFDPAGRYEKGAHHIGKRFSSELFTDEAIAFLQRRPRTAPFMMYVSYTAPHDPRMAPQRYERLYDRATLSLPPNILPEHPFDNGELTIRDEQLAPWPRTLDVIREHVGAYYAMISHLDDQLGRLLRALAASGQAHNTLIVFASDNGLAVGQHGLMGKQSLYDHSVRVPLVFSGVGLPRGERRETLCYLMDIMPTLCEMAQVACPADVEGRSLVPALADPHHQVRETLFYAYRTQQRAVRDATHKLIEYQVNGTRTTQLFDLANDPWERKNLAGVPEQFPVVKGLRKELVSLQEQFADPEQWLS